MVLRRLVDFLGAALDTQITILAVLGCLASKQALAIRAFFMLFKLPLCCWSTVTAKLLIALGVMLKFVFRKPFHPSSPLTLMNNSVNTMR